MKSNRKKPQVDQSRRLRGNHRKKSGPIWIYFILFVGVSITMITLNQVRKGKTRQAPLQETVSGSSTQFVKEGELDFLNAKGERITGIDIEIADDDLQTQRGMMYRRSLEQDHGMLFIFPDETERSFWMKNTLIALDILYVDAAKNIVSITENAPPRSEQSIWSEFPAKYVVEVNAGFVAIYGIRVGDQIRFKRTY